jgi:hypothetical protein
MSRTNIKVAMLAALALILPFAAGIVHAAQNAKPMAAAGKDAAKDKVVPKEAPTEKSVPAPTIDTNADGKADGWDRDGNGLVDAWDTNNDNKPDLFDDNGDGKPDDAKVPPANTEGEGEIRN